MILPSFDSWKSSKLYHMLCSSKFKFLLFNLNRYLHLITDQIGIYLFIYVVKSFRLNHQIVASFGALRYNDINNH